MWSLIDFYSLVYQLDRSLSFLLWTQYSHWWAIPVRWYNISPSSEQSSVKMLSDQYYEHLARTYNKMYRHINLSVQQECTNTNSNTNILKYLRLSNRQDLSIIYFPFVHSLRWFKANYFKRWTFWDRYSSIWGKFIITSTTINEDRMSCIGDLITSSKILTCSSTIACWIGLLYSREENCLYFTIKFRKIFN